MEIYKCQREYYHNHKQRILEEKRIYYINKTIKYAPFKLVRLRDVSFYISTKLIKYAIDNGRLLIIDDDEALTQDNFVEKYSINKKTLMDAYILDNSTKTCIHSINSNSTYEDCSQMIEDGHYLVLQMDTFKKKDKNI